MSNHSPMMIQPGLAALGGQQAGTPAWVRFPFFPTAPYYSTNPNVGTQVRYYSTGINSTEGDVSIGSETTRNISFDIPARIVAINGSCVNTAQNGPLPIGVDPRDCFLFRLEYSTGERLHITERLASTVLGRADSPGELGSTGFSVDAGATVTIGITPINSIPANFRVDITLHCLELRGSANFIGGR